MAEEQQPVQEQPVADPKKAFYDYGQALGIAINDLQRLRLLSREADAAEAEESPELWDARDYIKPVFKFEMGALAKDVLTGFTGIITARAQFLTGCANYKLQPQELKDGKPQEGEMFDENRLQIIGEGIKLEGSNTPAPQTNQQQVATTGGPQPKITQSNRSL